MESGLKVPAAGVFMQVLRPFKVGDFIQAGGAPESLRPCVRPYCHTGHAWQVYFDTHKAISTTFRAAGYPMPETRIAPSNR